MSTIPISVFFVKFLENCQWYTVGESRKRKGFALAQIVSDYTIVGVSLVRFAW